MTIKELIQMTPCAYDFSENCAIQVENLEGAHYRKDSYGNILEGGEMSSLAEVEFYNKTVRYLEWSKDVLLVTVY